MFLWIETVTTRNVTTETIPNVVWDSWVCFSWCHKGDSETTRTDSVIIKIKAGIHVGELSDTCMAVGTPHWKCLVEQNDKMWLYKTPPTPTLLQWPTILLFLSLVLATAFILSPCVSHSFFLWLASYLFSHLFSLYISLGFPCSPSFFQSFLLSSTHGTSAIREEKSPCHSQCQQAHDHLHLPKEMEVSWQLKHA